MIWGPNVKKLVIHKMSLDAIPKGGGIAAGIKFLSDPKQISVTARHADEWVKKVILAVRQAADPNPYRNATDEEIAEALLKKIEQKRTK